MGRKLLDYSLPAMILGLSIGGALTHNIPCLLAMVLVICITVGLVGFGKLDKRMYPILLGVIGLSLLYQTTLYSSYLIGTDIHKEYYYFKLAYDSWDINIPCTYNSAMGITVLAPFLSKLLHIDGIWVFKVIYPFLFSLAPIVLYFAFRKLLSTQGAFLSSFFFISVPVFSLEAVGLSKLQIGGLLLALLVLVLLSNLKGYIRLASAVLLSIGICISYYTVGFLLLGYLFLGIVVLSIILLIPKLHIPKALPLEGLVILTVIISIISFVYFGFTSQGVPLKVFTFYGISNVFGINPKYTMPLIEGAMPEDINEFPTFSPPPMDSQDTKTALLGAALGLDFKDASLSGKAFRVLQLTTELFIISGGIYLLINRRKYPNSYLTFVAVSFLFLLLMLIKPGFANLLNVTRLYHITLYTLAPLIVFGAVFLFKNKATPIISVVLILYFLFTSGFIFEVTKAPNIETLDIPYSIALSSYRIDISGIYEKEDEQAVDWLIANWNSEIPIYADLPGAEYLFEFIEIGPTKTLFFPQHWVPNPLTDIPNNSYIFLRRWAVDHQEVTYWVNIGLRRSYTYQEIGMDKLLEGRSLLYDMGAQIYGPKK